MERASTFFGVFGSIVQNCVRHLILIGRRYQIVPAIYLVVFFVGIISIGNKPVLPPSSSPVPASPSPYSSNPTPYSNPAPAYTPAPPPAIVAAQVKAFKSGNTVSVRFDKVVSQVQLSFDGGNSFTPTCEFKTCTATVPEETLQVQVTWNEGVESFSINFRL